MRFGGAMLVTVGVLLLSGAWDAMVQSLQSWVTGYEPPV
jgi:cytochrome c-type biogenesis protein